MAEIENSALHAVADELFGLLDYTTVPASISGAQALVERVRDLRPRPNCEQERDLESAALLLTRAREDFLKQIERVDLARNKLMELPRVATITEPTTEAAQ